MLLTSGTSGKEQGKIAVGGALRGLKRQIRLWLGPPSQLPQPETKGGKRSWKASCHVQGGSGSLKCFFPKALGNLPTWSNPLPPHPWRCLTGRTSLNSHCEGCHLQCRRG